MKTITCKADCIIVNYVFGRVDFREDLKKKKKKKEAEEEKLFGECLVRRGRGKKHSEAQVFSPRAHQKVFSSK